jgi:hypothetical protein
MSLFFVTGDDGLEHLVDSLDHSKVIEWKHNRQISDIWYEAIDISENLIIYSSPYAAYMSTGDAPLHNEAIKVFARPEDTIFPLYVFTEYK